MCQKKQKAKKLICGQQQILTNVSIQKEVHLFSSSNSLA